MISLKRGRVNDVMRINRNAEYRDKVRSYKVIVDDVHIGKKRFIRESGYGEK